MHVGDAATQCIACARSAATRTAATGVTIHGCVAVPGVALTKGRTPSATTRVTLGADVPQQEPVADHDDSQTSGGIPRAAYDLIAQLRAVTERLAGLTGLKRARRVVADHPCPAIAAQTCGPVGGTAQGGNQHRERP
jgi:hypothetical protein